MAPDPGGPARLRRRRHRGGPAAGSPSPGTSTSGSGPRWSSSASPCAAPSGSRRRPRAGRRPERCSPPTPPTWSPASLDVVIEVIGGIEPARTPDPVRDGARRLGGHRQQGPARRGRRDALRRRREVRRRPLLRGRGGRRDPAAAPAARVDGRRQGQPGARHRQRHHELHPLPDARDRRRLHRGAGGGHAPSATPRPTRPPTSRASTPPPRPRSWPSLAFHSRVTAADVYREGITEVSSADVAQRPRDELRHQAARDLRALRGRLQHRRAGAPGDDPARAPPRRGRRRVQRGLHRGRLGRTGHVLRPRRRWRPDGQRRARRPRRRGPAPGRRRPRAGGVGLRAARGPPDGRDHHPVLRQPRRGREARRAGPGRDRLRRARRLDPDGASARATPTTRRWSSSPTARRTPRWPRRWHSCAPWTPCGPSPA